MNFQQLRIIRETVRRNFNLTEVANALHTSQSGVSKHIKDLEDELGVELFVRKGKRLLGLDGAWPGTRGIVDAFCSTRRTSRSSASNSPTRIAAARQSRPRIRRPATRCRKVVTEFKKNFPTSVSCCTRRAPTEIVAMLRDGRADIGIATEALQDVPELATFPWYSWHHGVIVPRGIRSRARRSSRSRPSRNGRS